MLPTVRSNLVNPLESLTADKDAVIDAVCERLLSEIPDDSRFLDDYLADSLFWERKRLESRADPLRDAIDSTFWQTISPTISDQDIDSPAQRALVEKIARYHLHEISGHFDPRTYKIATTLVPRGFLWLLHALSWKTVRGMFQEKIDLRNKVIIGGQLAQLRKLAEKGTVLFVPTHFSNLDSVLVGWALYDAGLPPFAYGAGLNLFTNPALGYFMNNLGAYKVDRRKKHRLYRDTLKHYSTVLIERGVHSLFFPGGGRSRSGAIETHLKMGLLGTGLSAYTNNLLNGKLKPNIYVVPCVLSYNFVLEAGSLIEDYLAEQGKSRYLGDRDESNRIKVIAQFIYKFFTHTAKIQVNVGRAMDIFGHLVDDEGNSINESGSVIDPSLFVKSGGVICHSKQRDEEYTRILADRILNRYRVENVALSSHFLAYVYFGFLKNKFPDRDIYKLVRLSPRESRVPMAELLAFSEPLLKRLHEHYRNGKILLEPALRSTEIRNVIDSGLRNLGVYHSRRPVRLETLPTGERLVSDDVKLLFYYHNRMTGYDIGPE